MARWHVSRRNYRSSESDERVRSRRAGSSYRVEREAAAERKRREEAAAALKAEGLRCSAYVPSPISTWKRLDPNYDGPRVMWTQTLKANGVDYASMETPNAEHKVAHSIEIPWNYIDVDPGKMKRLASVFQKVEENLDELRGYERSQ